MYSLQVVSSEKAHSGADNTDYYDVTVEILKDGQVLESRRLAYTEEQLLADGGVAGELKAYLENYVAEVKQAEEAKAQELKQAEVDKALEGLKTLEVTVGQVVPPVQPEVTNED